jgi:hypothetical protein
MATLAFSTGAAAQLYKCKGPDGKIVYSDTRCEAAASGNALKVSPNSTTGGPPQDAAPIPPPKPGEVYAPVEEEAAAATPAARKRYELTSSDRDRIRNLEVNASRLGAYSEQKSAAQLEIQNIRNGAESRLSSGDREKRDALTADLSSTDAKKRSRALREIRELYYR